MTQLSLDDLTLSRITDQQTPFMPILEMLPDLSETVLASNRQWLMNGNAIDGSDMAVFCFQSYIVQTPHHVILVDSGIGNDKPRHRPLWHMQTSDRYMTALKSAGFSVEDIDYVLCTHLHPDHVGWNTRLEDGRWVPTFPNAQYVFGKSELEYWIAKNAASPVPCIVDSVVPIVEAGRHVVADKDFTIGDHLRVLPAPGHTPGLLAFVFGKGKDTIVCAGDLMHSPLQVRFPDMSPKFDVDRATSASTRWAFLERYADTDTLCCPAHFPEPRRIRRAAGSGFSFDAA